MSGRLEGALLSVRWPDGGVDALPSRRTAAMLAPAVLDLLDSPEAREVAARACRSNILGGGAFAESIRHEVADSILAALREWLGAES